MYTLLIDTCHEKSFVALTRGEEVVLVSSLPSGLHSSSHLLPAIHAALMRMEISTKDLSAIACASGPGSYTGMRVGAVAAKTLAYALQLPLIGWPTLIGFVPQSPGPFAAVMDAKIGGVYLLTGVKGDNGVVTYASEQIICPLEHMATHLTAALTLISPQVQALKLRLADAANNWLWQESTPDINCIAKYVQHALKQPPSTPYFGHLHLHYLRACQAEIDKQNAKSA